MLGEVYTRVLPIASGAEHILVEIENAPAIVEAFLCMSASMILNRLETKKVQYDLKKDGFRHA